MAVDTHWEWFSVCLFTEDVATGRLPCYSGQCHNHAHTGSNIRTYWAIGKKKRWIWEGVCGGIRDEIERKMGVVMIIFHCIHV